MSATAQTRRSERCWCKISQFKPYAVQAALFNPTRWPDLIEGEVPAVFHSKQTAYFPSKQLSEVDARHGNWK